MFFDDFERVFYSFLMCFDVFFLGLIQYPYIIFFLDKIDEKYKRNKEPKSIKVESTLNLGYICTFFDDFYYFFLF
jgi:hypothetical protein